MTTTKNKIVYKFVAKLFDYRIMFKGIISYLGPDYKDALLMILYLDIIRIIVSNKIN